MKKLNHSTIADYFGWKNHPFTDTRQLKSPFMGERDKRIMQQALDLLSYGKSFAITGPSGAGKSTLLQHLLLKLDTNYYKPVFIHYGGLQRSGVLRAVADKFGVETAGRAVPLLVKLQKHIASTISGTSPVHPVIVVDDAQHLERESLTDLCSLIVCPPHKTAAASLVIAGDEMLARILGLESMTQIQTRLTANLRMEPLNEKEVARFIAYRLEQAKAPKDLFEPDAISLIAAQCRGNRRKIMNAGTVLLDEALYREEKTINSQLMAGCELFS